MGLLYLISAWVYGGDVAALSDPTYSVRAAAHARLQAAGWLAYLSLDGGGDTPEAAERCGQIIGRLRAPLRSVAWAVQCDADDFADDELLYLRPAVCREAVRLRVSVIKRYAPDGSGSVGFTFDPTWPAARLEAWLAKPHYLSGHEAGDVRLLLEAARRQRRAFGLLPAVGGGPAAAAFH